MAKERIKPQERDIIEVIEVPVHPQDLFQDLFEDPPFSREISRSTSIFLDEEDFDEV